MKPGILAKEKKLQVYGRSPIGEDITLFLSGSGVRFVTDATDVWIELEAAFDRLDLWIEVFVNDELSQRRSLEKGKNRIHLWGGGELKKNREFKILRTTQGYFEDTVSYIKIKDIEANGNFAEVKEKDLFLEFIGDSITSGEGAALTKEEDWVPAVFSCSNDYAYLTAKELDADYNVVSQSGFGLYAAWNGDRTLVIPPHYEKVAGTLGGVENAAAGAQDDWDFGKRKVDAVILNLGTNDQFGLKNLESKKEQEKFLQDFKAVAVDFLKKIRKNNPDAYILWAYGMMGADIKDTIEAAVNEYSLAAGDEKVSLFILPLCTADELGMRDHPTLKGHIKAAKALSEELRGVLSSSGD